MFFLSITLVLCVFLMKNEDTLISNLSGIHVDNLRCAGRSPH